ncbi:unnamed protein product [Cochlearia groenlandica]
MVTELWNLISLSLPFSSALGHSRRSVFCLPGILGARYFRHPVNKIIGLFWRPVIKLSGLDYSRLFSVPSFPGARLASVFVHTQQNWILSVLKPKFLKKGIIFGL